ncbi:MAG: TrgA family protein [Amylibacter sp.]
MLTATKLVGALLLALTSLYSTHLFLSVNTTPYLGVEIYYMNTILGFLVGWRSIGFDPGFGGIWSIVSGLRACVLLVFISAITFGAWTVAIKLEKFFIREFGDVLVSWYDATIGYFSLISDPKILLVLFIGGCLSGIGAGLANRYWA